MTSGPSIKIANYKAFGSEPQGFEELKLVNLVVGRNNSGKSALLDAIEFLASGEFDPDPLTRRSASSPVIQISDVLAEVDLQKRFPASTSGGAFPGNHWTYGSKWIGGRITYDILPGYVVKVVAAEPQFDEFAKPNFQGVVENMARPFSKALYRRVSSDRDIVPETAGAHTGIEDNGAGATTIIANFINQASLPREAVSHDVLGALNRIFHPDTRFDEVVAQQHESGEWEIFLLEAKKGPVPLSQSGSGLKTILLVLANLYLVPALSGTDVSEFVFVFEELENNLHPAIQRRLFRFLRDLAIEEEFTLFLSTHSNVVIDLFATDSEVQIVHVTHDGVDAAARKVTTYVESLGILDDLDVRASDLLQANGVIWVEGPTDRLFIRRWIDLYSDGELKEGLHYQIVPYGGRLLAHLQAAIPDNDPSDLLSLMRINRNHVVTGDSDKSAPTANMNATKRRIRDETKQAGGLAWFSDGREIENYLHVDVVSDILGIEARQVGRFEPFEAYLEETQTGSGSRFSRDKVSFAELAVPSMHRGRMDVLDLEERLEEVVQRIRRWNGLQ